MYFSIIVKNTWDYITILDPEADSQSYSGVECISVQAQFFSAVGLVKYLLLVIVSSWFKSSNLGELEKLKKIKLVCEGKIK